MIIRLSLLTLVSIFILSSCDPCKKLDCVSSDFDMRLKIVSAETGKDLVFGSDKVYDASKIKFYILKGSDTTLLSKRIVDSDSTTFNRYFEVTFFPKIDTAYLQLNNKDIDTLFISYKSRNTRCCGVITEITNLNYNNRLNILDGGVIQEIKK